MRLTPAMSCIAALAVLAAAPLARAADPHLAGQRLAASCASCHGANGTPAGGGLPALTGQPKENLVTTMKAFQSGARPATIMHQLAKGYTDEQIELIAAYFAAQKK